ncbi:MAG: ABC transporter permease [Imperialibacter sp.]|uniref:ABC transporter permease n=1 Tax=Imperialibacter sp. TaxID=2038411 RepID=UPI0032EC6A8E
MHNLTAYLRFLSRHKTLSFINVFGLAIGFAACIFIGLYITEEVSYDQYHEKLDRIYVVTSQINSGESLTKVSTAPGALAAALKNSFPEVEEAVRLVTMGGTVKYKDKIFNEDDIYQADREVFKVFTYPLLEGDPNTALTAPESIVLTQSLARKYFEDEDPLSKSIIINDRNFQVTGVMKDLPAATDLKFSALATFDNQMDDSWFDIEYFTYILFDKSYQPKGPAGQAFADKLTSLTNEYLNEPLKEEGLIFTLPLTPLADVHFREPVYDDTPKGNMRFIYIIGAVALLMLLIGSLNFINFSLLQSLERGKEVGIRKIVGARYHQLVVKYLTESVIIAFLAFTLSLVVVVLFMPLFNNVSGKSLEVQRLFTPGYIGSAVVIVLLVGVLAGSFPAFFTSSIQPLQSLKGKISGLKGQWFRKASILAQFAIAIGLIIGTLLINRQMQFINNYDLGFRKENIIVVNTPADSVSAGRVGVFKEALLQNNTIQLVSKVGWGAIPGKDPMKGTIKVKPNGDSRLVNILNVDEDYVNTLNIQMLEGRNFDASRPNDKKQAVLVNEAFARLWGWEKPLTEKVVWDEEVEVIGVIRDFHFKSLRGALEPTVMVFEKNRFPNTIVRFNANVPVTQQISVLEEEWKKVFPNKPFSSYFLDQSIAEQYIAEERTFTLFTSFSTLTIIVSCLGLFGLCSLSISQRRKEVGIRKVIGASYRSMISLFSKEYLVLIGLAFVLISPVVYLLISQWLESFTYRENVSLFVFIATAVGVCILGLLTVVLSIGKTWNSNPASLIRD